MLEMVYVAGSRLPFLMLWTAPPPARECRGCGRHALGFQDADHLVDFPGVEFDPAFLTKLIKAVRRARALLRRVGRRRIVVVGGIVRRQFGIDRLVLGLCDSIGCTSRLRARFRVARLGLRLGFGVLLVALFVG